MNEELPKRREITKMLQACSDGNREAMDELIPYVYDELHHRAHRYLNRERKNHTLQTTALVHEAYLRLIDQKFVDWQSRAHFFGVAANMMRRILVNYAVSRKREKRGGAAENLPLEQSISIAAEESDVDLVELDRVLSELETFDERQAKIVEMRFFSGLSIRETAEVLHISASTVKRDWLMAKAWLRSRLDG